MLGDWIKLSLKILDFEVEINSNWIILILCSVCIGFAFYVMASKIYIEIIDLRVKFKEKRMGGQIPELTCSKVRAPTGEGLR